MKTLAPFALALSVTALASAQAPSQRVDFTAAEGFVDGPADGQNGIFAQADINIDTAHGGRITSAANNYKRFVAFADTIDMGRLGVGQSVTLVARGVRMQRELPDQVRQCFGFGLSLENRARTEMSIGTQLLFDPQGRLWIDDYQWGIGKNPVDTGQRYDQPFDVVTVVTRTGPRAFAAETTVNGVTAQTGVATDVDPLRTGVLCQVQGKTTGRWSVDALEVNPATLPGAFVEPQ